MLATEAFCQFIIFVEGRVYVLSKPKFFRFVRQEFVSVMNRNYLEAALVAPIGTP